MTRPVVDAVFFDTNVLLYVLSADAEKADITEGLLAQGGATSVQALNEFTNVSSRKFRMPLADVREALAVLRRCLTVVPVTQEVHALGLDLLERYRFPVYDSMIVAAALISECTVLWTEDLQSRLKVDRRLELRNPFA